ncbi:MAG: YkgJ family cysteine cluster protein [Kiritimatiellia bacterium]|jgi:Fe-S-cluster containining protein
MTPDLTSFSCQRCGACCRVPGIVHLHEDDIPRIAAFLGMTEEAFLETMTRLSSDRQGLLLVDRPDGSCGMLDESNRCRIYPVRPEQCRTFPHAWTNANSASYCPALRACLGRRNPGNGRGGGRTRNPFGTGT